MTNEVPSEGLLRGADELHSTDVERRKIEPETPESRLLQTLLGKLAGRDTRFAIYSGDREILYGYTSLASERRDFLAFVEGDIRFDEQDQPDGQNTQRVLLRWL